jgi:hypothetical protein
MTPDTVNLIAELEQRVSELSAALELSPFLTITPLFISLNFKAEIECMQT